MFWVDFAGKPHLIDEMTEAYVRNVISFLETHTEYFYLGALRACTLQMVGDALLGRIGAERAAIAAGAPAMTEVEPATWLESTPLMRKLRRRTRQS